jgi:hypothetical protein
VKLWIRIDVAIRSDPNVAELAARLKLRTAEAVGLCTLLWAAIAEHRPSGDLTGIGIPALEEWARWEPRKGQPAGAFGQAFMDLFVTQDDGDASAYEASGWLERQGKLVALAEKDRQRKPHRNPQDIHGKSTPTERDVTERDATEPKEAFRESDAERESISEHQAQPPASLLENLPREAKQLLRMFYEFPAMTERQRERYRNVAMQLVDALDPKHPGPKIRGGQRVKARSKEHLADVCRAVMKDPPNDRDFAIVFVLKKLTDPEKGPSVTELAQRHEQSEHQLEDQYHAAAQRAGVVWAQQNPEDYQPILAEVDARYRGRSGSIVTMARTAELTQRCAKAAGFPTFEHWMENGSSSKPLQTAVAV